MIERHVMIKLVDPLANEVGRAACATHARDALAAIPGVRDVHVGVAATPDDAASWDLALVLRFDDLDAVDAYRVDPLHVAFVDDWLAPRTAFEKAWNFRV